MVYTPLHGVGDETVETALPAPASQRHRGSGTGAARRRLPDRSFPNPEEPGAMDLAMALAAEQDADIVVANDPDADRCAVAVPT